MSAIGLFEYLRDPDSDANCSEAGILSFPSDGLTRTTRAQGWITIHFLLSLYLFLAIAILCNEYFVPAVERFSVVCNMSTDVAGATFMAMATSAPELGVNIIGTFVTRSDLGVGDIVGSAVFNALGVSAFCGVFAGVTIKLDWWPLTRDCIIYAISISLLITTLYDSIVQWWEALGMLCFYVIYLLVLCNNSRLQRCVKQSSICQKSKCFEISLDADTKARRITQDAEGDEEDESYQLFKLPREKSIFEKFCWGIQYPIRILYFISIVDCRWPKLRHFYCLTFLLACVWISAISYLVSWTITAIDTLPDIKTQPSFIIISLQTFYIPLGDTYNIPDTVMGITFLAVGTSIPETATSIIVARRGYGAMAVCNSIGSNTFDILVCLGLPWLIKATLFPTKPGVHSVYINSQGIVYSTITLLAGIALLYSAFVCTKFTLGKIVGVSCLLGYLLYVIFATLIEMNVFFQVNLPICEHDQ